MSENNRYDELETLTPEQVAKMMGVTVATIWRHARQGKIPHFRLGPRLIRFNRRAIEDFQRRQRDVAVTSK